MTRDSDTSKLKPLAIGNEMAKMMRKNDQKLVLFGTTFPASNTAQPGSLLHKKETNDATIDADGGLTNLVDSDISCNHCLANFKLEPDTQIAVFYRQCWAFSDS
jgi:hypothetical protein